MNVVRLLSGRKRQSETDAMLLWTFIFKDGLPLDSCLSLHLNCRKCLHHRAMEDISIVGRACSPLALPTSPSQVRFSLEKGEAQHALLINPVRQVQ
ncbi:hypothetical protein BGZ54_009521 [Gamsiella multidivaricata]|nr:hypothetical protein BGZ54_009521 [Gamsiella multidivaricata]